MGALDGLLAVMLLQGNEVFLGKGAARSVQVNTKKSDFSTVPIHSVKHTHSVPRREDRADDDRFRRSFVHGEGEGPQQHENHPGS